MKVTPVKTPPEVLRALMVDRASVDPPATNDDGPEGGEDVEDADIPDVDTYTDEEDDEGSIAADFP